jgi:hypothetical protein
MVQQQAYWVFEPEATSVPRARAQIAQSLVEASAETRGVVLLLSSELVANAICHGTGPVGLRLTWGEGDVRVEVDDQSSAWRVPPHPIDPDAETGRGLLLVGALSDGWGVLVTATGKTVWFTRHASSSEVGSRHRRTL